MSDLVLFVIIGAVLLGYGAVWLVHAHRVRRRHGRDLARTWGQPERGPREGRPVDAWWRAFGDASGLDEDTWVDLELDGVFAWADRTLTALGAQVLRGWMRSPDPTLARPARRRALADAVAPEGTRVPVQARLLKLGDAAGWDAVRVLTEPAPALPMPLWAYRALALGLLGSVAAFAVAPSSLTFGLALTFGLVNPIVAVVSARRSDGHLALLRELRALVSAARDAHAVLPSEVRARFDVDDDLATAERVGRAGGVALVGPSGGDSVIESVLEYARMFLLTEPRAYLKMVREVEAHRDALRRAVGFLGEVDAALSLAHLRAHTDGLVEPDRLDGPPRVEAEAIRHPQLGDAVPNDVTLAAPGLLVTGSNMAGKSTFLRTLGANVLLAQSLGVACATSLAITPLRVVASMGADDDLSASVSLYQAEVLRLRELLETHDGTEPALVLLDEVFRGTNPHDRLAASSAVIWALAEHNLVVAATHDLELARTAGRPFALGHFAETVAGDTIEFDYRLRPGVSRTTNALSLLERLGYPPHVLSRAQAVRREVA